MSPPKACILALLCASANCTDDNTVVEIGQIEVDGVQAAIQVPTSGKIGEPVMVQLLSYGIGCSSFERTDINIVGDEADITPYDRRKVEGGCLAMIKANNHDVMVTFDTTGSKVIRVNGRHTDSVEAQQIDEPVQKTFPVTVVE